MSSRMEERETWDQLVRRMRRRDPDIPRNLLFQIPNLLELRDLCDPRRTFEDDDGFWGVMTNMRQMTEGERNGSFSSLHTYEM